MKRGRPAKWDGVHGEGRLIALWLAVEVKRKSKPGGGGSVLWACQMLAREGMVVVEDHPGRWKVTEWSGGQAVDAEFVRTGPTKRTKYCKIEGIREAYKRAEALLDCAAPGVRENWEAQAAELADEARRKKLG